MMNIIYKACYVPAKLSQFTLSFSLSNNSKHNICVSAHWYKRLFVYQSILYAYK